VWQLLELFAGRMRQTLDSFNGPSAVQATVSLVLNGSLLGEF
jgi:hypothetical protein